MDRHRWRPGWCLVWVLVAGAASTPAGCRRWPHVDPATTAAQEPYAPQPRFQASVNRPYATLAATTPRKDVLGKPARVPCMTCHATVGAQPENQQARHLPGFHQGINLVHGDLTCRSCHKVPGFEDLVRADGTPIPYAQAMTLCGQCHARRVTEYENGAHGGMTGSWDLSRGPRARNHCLDCHDPHAPAVGPVLPAPRHVRRPGT